MVDKLRAAEQRSRGEEAKSIINSPLFKDAFSILDAEIINSWRESKPEDEKLRHDAYLMQDLLHSLRRHFVQVMSTGKMAEAELLRGSEQIDQKSRTTKK